MFDTYPSPGRTGVLVVPGFWRTRTYPGLVAIAAAIAGRLAPCAVMDLRGHGGSGGVFEFGRREYLDVAAVGQRFVDTAKLDHLILLGMSAGGAIAISAAARSRDLPICGLILISAVSDFRRVIPRPNPFTIHRHLSLGQAIQRPRFRWPGSDRQSPLADAGSVATPACLIHGRNDWLVSHHHSEAIARRMQDAALHVLDVPGRYHADRLFDVAPGEVWPIIDEFVRRFTAWRQK